MQLTIFDVVDSQPFNVGDAVQAIDVTEDMDVETYYYLSKFKNKQGLILKVIKEPSLQYEIDFEGKFAILYHTELRCLT